MAKPPAVNLRQQEFMLLELPAFDLSPKQAATAAACLGQDCVDFTFVISLSFNLFDYVDKVGIALQG